MNHIAPMHESAIRDIPLCRLALAPENVRKTPPDEAAETQLRASIAEHDLLENLVVRPDEPDADGIERFAVVAGGRRLAALKALAENGTLHADHPVPCKIAANGNASELSLAENVVRIAMHPADQVVAFAGLAESGVTVAAIAARFGVSERTVEQRLRLGNAAPELLDAYRAEQFDLETLMAFAVTTDHDRQLSVWERVSGQNYRPSAWQVKRMLTEERVPAGAPTARFVGVDAYEAAGGPVLRDLFADEHENGVWLEDPKLLDELAMKKLQAAADELTTRWKWAEAMLDVDWSATARYGRIHPEPGEPTDAETAEIEKLRARHDELVNMDEDQWTDALVEEAEAIEPRLDEIEAGVESRARFKREDFAIAGCIATIGRDGSLQVIQGLVKPEDMPKDTGAAANGHDADADDDSAADTGRVNGPAITTPLASPVDPRAKAREEAGVGIGLADDLRAIRTALVKAYLAGDFEAAFDLVVFQMVRAVFARGYTASWHALDIVFNETADRPTTRTNDDDFADWSPGEAMLADWSHLPRTVETVVYELEELSEAAKESARAWYRETCLEHEWYDAVFDDFETICGILGVTLRTSPVKLMGGGTRENPHLFFRGFASQGDGASFEGQYSHAKGAARAIRAHAPKDEELHRIADELQAVQKRNFYQLSTVIRTRGNYCHEHSMAIDVERDSPTWQPMTDGAEDAVIEALRDLARWLYRQLEREYDYLTSDAAVDESIDVNQYTFTAQGCRFG